MPLWTSPKALAFALLNIIAVSAVGIAADEPSAGQSMELKFLQGLRERGYHDLALEYLDKLRVSKETPEDVRAILDYEEGKGLLEEASTMADLERRRETLDKARARLDSFSKAHPDHPKTPDALVQMARILVERGHTDVLSAYEMKGADAASKMAEARASFNSAREAYDVAVKSLQGALDKFPKYVPESDKRFPLVTQARIDVMNAKLQRALVDYEDAQTYAGDSKAPQGDRDRRNALLDTAKTNFEAIHRDFRLQVAGLYARMWQAKCYEEKGELGAAMGIYNELIDHPTTELRDLKRHVQYFQVIIDNKRGDYALAVDRAAAWLNNFPEARRYNEGLGVQLQLAKNILAQLDNMAQKDREEATRKAIERLTEVVRIYSPYKPEALELLRKYKPKAAISNNQIAQLNYSDAMSQADQAMANQEWDRAIAFLKQAVRKADPIRESENMNRARYFMAYCFYQSQKYYESAVIAEHLARHYPQGGLSAKSTEIGMEALRLAYNTFTKFDRESDLGRLISLADYTTKTWPDSDQADAARSTLGEVAIGTGPGHYLEASKWFEEIRPGSSRRNDALVRASDAHFREAAVLRAEGKTKDADAQAKQAHDLAETALNARKKAGVATTDPGYVTNVAALAEIDRDAGRPKEAIALLAPVAKALETAPATPEVIAQRGRILTTLLRSHIANGEANLAIADIKALETVISDPKLMNSLFVELGRQLKKEMDELETRGKQMELQRASNAYKQLLEALTNNEAGQSFSSLGWAGEQLLSLNKAPEALAVYDRILKLAKDRSDFLGTGAEAKRRLLIAQLRRVQALRQSGKFAEAKPAIDELAKENPKMLEILMEEGNVLSDGAKEGTFKWPEPLNFWTQLAAKLDNARPRPSQYYECWLHVAEARAGLGDKAKALQTLKGVMTLSPSVGSPEMKAKYLAMIRKLGS